MLEINHQFEDAVDAATDSGVITEEQNLRIFNTDLVALARDASPEMSFTSLWKRLLQSSYSIFSAPANPRELLVLSFRPTTS